MDFDKNDAAVGAFLVAALAAFLGALVFVNKERWTAKTYPLSIELAEISGLDKGAEVLYRGYRAGEVEEVAVTYEPRFRFVVRFKVKREIRLPAGTRVSIRGKGFTGGRYLDLKAPETAETGFVRPGAVLAVELEPDLVARANDVLGEAGSVMRRLKERGAADDAAGLLRDARAAVADLRRLLANANALLEENRASVRDSLSSARSAAAKADGLLDRRGAAIERSLQSIDQSLSHLPAMLADLEELAADLKRRPWRVLRKGDPPPEKAEHRHPAAP